jgi:hypothetical protein
MPYTNDNGRPIYDPTAAPPQESEEAYCWRRFGEIVNSPAEMRAYGHLPLDEVMEMLREEYYGLRGVPRS